MANFIRQQAELVRIAVERGEFPRFIYKYRGIDANLNAILTDAQLWYSRPDQFNDPFDCQLLPDTDVTLIEMKEFLRKADPNLSEQVVHTSAVNAIANPNKLQEIVENSISMALNQSGVCCFCLKPDNILLWAHYANKHQGVCLKYDILQDIEGFVTPLHVTYQKDYPRYNHFRNQSELFDKLVKTKSDHWSYEEEIRIFKTSAGLKPFNKASLVEIIFGARVSEDEITRLRNLVTANAYPNISFTKASLRRNEYGLDFTRLP